MVNKISCPNQNLSHHAKDASEQITLFGPLAAVGCLLGVEILWPLWVVNLWDLEAARYDSRVSPNGIMSTMPATEQRTQMRNQPTLLSSGSTKGIAASWTSWWTRHEGSEFYLPRMLRNMPLSFADAFAFGVPWCWPYCSLERMCVSFKLADCIPACHHPSPANKNANKHYEIISTGFIIAMNYGASCTKNVEFSVWHRAWGL